MTKYYQLNKIFHMGENLDKEYEKRITDLNTYNTVLKINSVKKGLISKEEYPLFLVNFKELNKVAEEIVRNSYYIKERAQSLPAGGKKSFLKTLLVNELQSTNEIENVRSTKKELSQLLNEVENDSYNKTYKKFEGLVDLYINLENDSTKINTVEDIRTIYDVLVSNEVDVDDRLDGVLFRKKEVGIYSAGSNKYLHKGVMPETNIILKLADMLNFLSNDEMPRLYKIMVVHYYFEYIHPFYDGNGRVGRYILGKLVAEHLDIYTAITFSYMVNRNKSKYYKAFENTSDPLNRGEVSFFVYDMLTIIKEGQEEVKEYLDGIISKFNKIAKFLKEYVEDEVTLKILRFIALNTLFPSDIKLTLKDITSMMSMSRITLNNKLDKYDKELVYLSKKPAIVVFDEDFLKKMLEE